MIRATLRRKASTWAILLGCGFALVRCGEDRIAGSSVTTGNPTEIQVGFTGENGPVAVAGRVEIYGATQIPVPGFRPEPLARYDVDGSSFTLTASHFEGIADSLWAKGSLEGDSLARFNLVITGASQGGILRGLAFLLRQGRFSLEEGAWTSEREVAKVKADITALIEYRAFIDSAYLAPDKFQFLFLKGTGYATKAERGAFLFPGVPAGSHSLSFVSVPDRDKDSSPLDSINVHGVDKELTAGKVDTIAATSVEFRVPTPDAYKPR